MVRDYKKPAGSRNYRNYTEDSLEEALEKVTNGSSASADDGTGTTAATPTSNEHASRQSNLQRIQQRKQQVYSWPHNKKLLKLAIYSACQTPECNCNGWKTPVPVQPTKGNPRADIQPLASLTDTCRNCNHILGKKASAVYIDVDPYSYNAAVSRVKFGPMISDLRYGDLSQVAQMVSTNYGGEETNDPAFMPFGEKNIRVFLNVSSKASEGDGITDMDVQMFETFDDLLNAYFQNFRIEGTDKPWKAFMGDWIVDEIMRTFGIEFDQKTDNCCYVLVKEYVSRAIESRNVTDTTEVRNFMKSYGTHYINSYITGNFIYQVFKYKRTGYNMLRSYIRLRNNRPSSPDNLRFYFSSYFLKQVGDIRVASGNKTVETWARWNLRDSQYLYSRPSLLRLHYNPLLVYKLNDLLDNKALLGLGLKTLRPLFRDRRKGEMYAEIIENDLKLWEVNA